MSPWNRTQIFSEDLRLPSEPSVWSISLAASASVRDSPRRTCRKVYRPTLSVGWWYFLLWDSEMNKLGEGEPVECQHLSLSLSLCCWPTKDWTGSPHTPTMLSSPMMACAITTHEAQLIFLPKVLSVKYSVTRKQDMLLTQHPLWSFCLPRLALCHCHGVNAIIKGSYLPFYCLVLFNVYGCFVCIYVYVSWVCLMSWRSEEGIISHGTGVMDGC